MAKTCAPSRCRCVNAVERTRTHRDARAAPTWGNRLLNIAERHFVKPTLALFLVVLPLLIFVLDRLHSRAG